MTGPLFGFSDTWQLVINTGTTIVTFLMVFLIQNTQNRDTEAIQLKLDELIRVDRRARTTRCSISRSWKRRSWTRSGTKYEELAHTAPGRSDQRTLRHRNSRGVTTLPPTRSRTSGTLHVIGVVLAVAAALWMLYRLEGLLLALALATWCAYVLAPPVELAQRPIRFRERSYSLTRGPAVAVVFVLLSGGVTAAAAVLLRRLPIR